MYISDLHQTLILETEQVSETMTHKSHETDRWNKILLYLSPRQSHISL
jgi:hypothetical protein